jgi:hypothetical protein
MIVNGVEICDKTHESPTKCECVFLELTKKGSEAFTVISKSDAVKIIEHLKQVFKL